MVIFLWKNREQPRFLSSRWLVVWAKRFITAWRLIKILFSREKLKYKGIHIGHLSIADKIEVNGKHRNISIGSHTFIADGVHVTSHGLVTIGSNVAINSGVRILSASHYLSDPNWTMFSRPITVGDYAWIATGATILPGVNIGYGAVIGAGAVVTIDVPDYALAVGNPARIFEGKRSKELQYSPVIFTVPYEAWLGRNMPVTDCAA